MPVTLSSLTSAQIRMLIRLDDGHPHEDSVGVEIEELTGNQMRTADSLVARGLVEMRIGPAVGRSFSAWYRLTPEGRQIRDYGQTGQPPCGEEWGWKETRC